MKLIASGIAVAVLLASLVSSARADKTDDIRGQKKELEQVQRDVKKSQDRLDSLKREEKRLLNDISEYDQRVTSSQQVISRLSREYSQLLKSIADAEAQLQAQEGSLAGSQRRFLSNIRQLYLSTRESGGLNLEHPEEEMDLNRRVVYLTSLANYESGTVAEASQVLEQTAKELQQLSGAGRQISSLKRKKEAAYSLEKARLEKREKTLERLRRLSRDEADRVMTLQKSAQEMEQLVARLEKSQQDAAKPQPGRQPAVNFAGLKGRLPLPFAGKVVSSFGTSVSPVTNLKSFSPGVVFKGKANDRVLAVAAGTVVYTGNLRGYGNFVIINHDNQYYTTYAGLDRISVAAEQTVAAGTTVGQSGGDGLVKFEIRKGREPVDPVEWMKIESF
jgi:septal ring factor EnvC (AmiA/AmiB activator)